MYVPLRVHSHFSMLTGVDSPGALVERARDLRIPALALTDVDGTAGLVEFLRAAEDSSTPGTPETSVRPVERIPGEEPPEERGLHSGSGSGFNPGPGSGPGSGPRPIVGAELTDGGGRAGRLVALVEDEEGHRNLCRLISMRHGSRVEGVPVEELTDADLQSMHKLFRPGYSYEWCLAAFQRRYVKVDTMYVDLLNLKGDGDATVVCENTLQTKYKELQCKERDEEGGVRRFGRSPKTAWRCARGCGTSPDGDARVESGAERRTRALFP